MYGNRRSSSKGELIGKEEVEVEWTEVISRKKRPLHPIEHKQYQIPIMINPIQNA